MYTPDKINNRTITLFPTLNVCTVCMYSVHVCTCMYSVHVHYMYMYVQCTCTLSCDCSNAQDLTRLHIPLPYLPHMFDDALKENRSHSRRMPLTLDSPLSSFDQGVEETKKEAKKKDSTGRCIQVLVLHTVRVAYAAVCVCACVCVSCVHVRTCHSVCMSLCMCLVSLLSLSAVSVVLTWSPIFSLSRLWSRWMPRSLSTSSHLWHDTFLCLTYGCHK